MVRSHRGKYHFFRSVAAILLTAVVLSGCAGGADSGGKGPIRVGVIVDAIGSMAAIGEGVIRGAETAMIDANAAGGVRARKLEAAVEGGGGDPESALMAARKLVETEKVAVIINGTGGDVFLKWAEHVRSKGIVVVNAVAGGPQVRGLGATVYTVTVAAGELGGELARWANEDRHRRVAVLHPAGPLGDELRKGAGEVVGQLGGTVVASVGYVPGRADYRSEVDRIVASRPDAVISLLAGKDGELLFRQSTRVGLLVPWYLAYPSQLVVGDLPQAEGRVFGIEVGYTLPAAEKFREAYARRYPGSVSTPWAAYAYDGTWLVVYAMRRAGTEASEIARVYARVAYGYAGATGAMTFDSDGVRTASPLERLKVSGDGKLIPAR